MVTNWLINFSVSQRLAPEISVDAYIGSLSVVGMLDFEVTPVYRVLLEARDDSKGGGAAISCLLTVRVINVNEPPCVIYSWKDRGEAVAATGAARYAPSVTPCSYTTSGDF